MPEMQKDPDEMLDVNYANDKATHLSKGKPEFLKNISWSRVTLFLLPVLLAGGVLLLIQTEEESSVLRGKPELLKRMEQQRQQPQEVAKETELAPDTAVDTEIDMSAQDTEPNTQALERFFEQEPPAEAVPHEEDASLPIPKKQEQGEITPTAISATDSTLPISKDWQQAFAAQQQQLSVLQNQLSEMRQEMHKEREHLTETKQLLLHFSFFKAYVLDAKPFKNELRLLLGADAISREVKTSLEYFTPLASEGIASLDILQQEFNISLTYYYQAKTENPQDMLGKAGGWLSSLVTVRKIGGEHQGNSDEDILARAEHWLKQGNVAHALKELSHLSVQASPYFKEWRANAYAYQHARELLPEIEQQLFNL